MKVTICDRCSAELVNRKKGRYERYDTVSLSPQERLDLCSECYKHFGTLNERLQRYAVAGIESMNKEREEAIQEFWEGGENGKETPGDSSRRKRGNGGVPG